MTYVYVASSWRNQLQPQVCASLAAAGIDHYDFRNPSGGEGFSWKQVQPGHRCASCLQPIYYSRYRNAPGSRWEPDFDPYNDRVCWRHAGGYAACDDLSGMAAPGEVDAKGTDWVAAVEYVEMVNHPVATAGFHADLSAMKRADTFVMVLPCGKSAHLELGWAAGAGKRTAILLEDPVEPELMYRCADLMTTDLEALIRWVSTS